ncbi:MAG: gluconate 2-dehydrogenase subunit 3 family protein [Bryobacterales bacterium]|nr:gluconate 2-dehydrogenase subunit 3 family protein [Bryobacterales bacterium]
MNVPRRRFLLSASSALLAAGTFGCNGFRQPYRLFDAKQAAILSALCEQIIPTDDTPGAAWAHVVKFIDRQLVYHYQNLGSTYRNGLISLDRAAIALHRAAFEALPFDTQTVLVAKLEVGEIAAPDWPADAQRALFRAVRAHTMQGYYGDPRHGGNREMIGWRTLGLPHPPVRGRDDYRFPKERSAQSGNIAVTSEARP